MIHSIRQSDSFDFRSPVRLHLAAGAIDNLGDSAGIACSVLIVTGRSSARKSGLLDRVTAAMGNRRATVFDGVEPNPSIPTCERGAAVATKAGADLVIGLGGGSAMDAAKVIAAIAPNGGRFGELLGKTHYPHQPIRHIAVPTTCGTGSEVNAYAIITDPDKADKVNFSSPQTFPELGVLDPTVLDSIPRELLIHTAFDAFTHALEGYVSRRSQPVADTLAVEAMGMVLHHLPAAAEGDADAKANLLLAASLAGIVIAHTGTTMLHALGYYLTLKHGLGHGHANAIMLPLLMRHIRDACADRFAAVVGLLPTGDRSAEGMERYLAEMGIETALSAHGMGADEFGACADYALARSSTAATPGAVDRQRLIDLLAEHA